MKNAVRQILFSVQSLLFKRFPFKVGYSLRQLNPDANLAIRVRRISDNTELNIGFVRGELDVSSLLNFVGVSDGLIATWYSQGISQNHLIASGTNDNYPLIVEAGVLVTDNGKVAIRFGRVSFTPLRYANTNIILQPFSVFMTAKYVASSSNGAIFFDSNSSLNTKRALLGVNGASPFSLEADSSGVLKIEITRDTNRNLFYGLFNSTSSVFGLNTSSTLGGVGTNSLDGLTVGTLRPLGLDGSYGLKGFIQEIIFYESNETGNRDSISGNINKYYGIY